MLMMEHYNLSPPIVTEFVLLTENLQNPENWLWCCCWWMACSVPVGLIFSVAMKFLRQDPTPISEWQVTKQLANDFLVTSVLLARAGGPGGAESAQAPMILSNWQETPSCLPGGQDPPHVMQGLLSQIISLHLHPFEQWNVMIETITHPNRVTFTHLCIFIFLKKVNMGSGTARAQYIFY